jgi:hypothetical protein
MIVPVHRAQCTLKFSTVDYRAACSLQTGPHMLDAGGWQWRADLHDQVLLCAIICTGIPLLYFSCFKTLADSRLQMAATMMSRATALALGG